MARRRKETQQWPEDDKRPGVPLNIVLVSVPVGPREMYDPTDFGGYMSGAVGVTTAAFANEEVSYRNSPGEHAWLRTPYRGIRVLVRVSDMRIIATLFPDHVQADLNATGTARWIVHGYEADGRIYSRPVSAGPLSELAARHVVEEAALSRKSDTFTTGVWELDWMLPNEGELGVLRGEFEEIGDAAGPARCWEVMVGQVGNEKTVEAEENMCRVGRVLPRVALEPEPDTAVIDQERLAAARRELDRW